MDKTKILSILRKLTDEYLKKDKDKKSIVKELSSKVSVDEVLSFQDGLITNSYYALKYLDDDFQTPDCEIQFLKECYDGKRVFSQTERDNYIKESMNPTAESAVSVGSSTQPETLRNG